MIWNRYIVKEFLYCCLSFLLFFNFLYILIDYASHSAWFYFDHHFQWKIFFTYYLCDLLHRFNAIAPFILLLSSIKVVSQLVLTNELLAMMASGTTVKKLLNPIVAVAFIFLALTYLNLEWIDPGAIRTLNELSNARHSQKKTAVIQQMSLDDSSILLFHQYDTSRNLFSDAYWIRHTGDLYHMKSLKVAEASPIGAYVDHFERNAKGELVKTESAKERPFPEMRLNMERLDEILIRPEDQPISKLWKKLPKEKHLYLSQEAQVLAAFYNKLATPWLCLLAVLAPIPFCLNFTRKVPLFAIYAGSLFGLIAFTILLNSAFLLGKRQILDPFLATSLPFLTVFSYFSWRYIKRT